MVLSARAGGGRHIAMRVNSLAKAVSAAIAGIGLTIAVGAALIGHGLPYRDWLIVAGIDALAIGGAAFVLAMIFSDRPASPPLSIKPRMRSLESADGQELKRTLVHFIAGGKPVTISYPAGDPEAERFAGQIGQFLHENSFTVVGFAAAPPTVRLDRHRNDDGNHILVGPIGSGHRPPRAEAADRPNRGPGRRRTKSASARSQSPRPALRTRPPQVDEAQCGAIISDPGAAQRLRLRTRAIEFGDRAAAMFGS